MNSILPLSPRNAVSGLALLALALACAAPAQEAVETDTQELQPAVTYADLLPNGVEPLPGVVAGGQPTREQLDEAANRGLRTVINLRTEGESDIGQEDVEARGMTYVALPIAGTDDLNAETAAALDAALALAEQPVMVHCGSGNRVGALFALRAYFVEGASLEQAMTFGEDAGMTRLGDSTREILEAAAQAALPIN